MATAAAELARQGSSLVIIIVLGFGFELTIRNSQLAIQIPRSPSNWQQATSGGELQATICDLQLTSTSAANARTVASFWFLSLRCDGKLVQASNNGFYKLVPSRATPSFHGD